MNDNKLYIAKGFTLIEVIISIVIIGLIAVILTPILSNSTITFNNVQSRKTIMNDNLLVLQKLSQDLDFLHSLISYDSKSIQFTTTADTTQIIDYQLNNDGTISRKVGSGSYNLIAQNIDYSSSQFTYFDVNGNVGSPVHRIRLYLLYSFNGLTSPITMDIVPYTFR
jgi:prepilin-type N-terminal cleavage/methylation domain-containing protein